jgi:hypothetical protein
MGLPLNTPIGAGSAAVPTDSTTGTSPATLIFSNVTVGGTTTLTTGAAAPPAPAGFVLGATTYNIATTAQFNGAISICLSYSPADFPNPAAIALLHYQNNAWVNVTTSITANTVCGSVPSFSPIAIATQDLTPPTVGFSVTPSPNGSGWNNSAATLTWNIGDTDSGISSSLGCGVTALSAETPGTSFSCNAVNGAGTSVSASVNIKIDKTPPNAPLASVSPAPNAAGWNTNAVTVAFAPAGDSGPVQSGIATCSPSTLLSTSTAGTAIVGMCSDVAGNNSAATTVVVKIDQTIPAIASAISPHPNTAGWNNSAVTVTWSVADPESGIQSSVGCDPVTISTDTGAGVLNCSSTNNAGLSSVATVAIKLDRTPPVVSAITTTPAAVFALAPFTLTAAVADTLSGVASAQYSVDGGGFSAMVSAGSGGWSAAIASLSAGDHNICVVAADVAANSSSPVCTVVTVSKLTATVTINGASLSTVYDGTAKAVLASTNPNGVAFVITYNGSTAPPTGAGSYTVIATVTDSNYLGTASGTLVIAKATPTLNWPNPAAIVYGTPLGAGQLNAVASTAGSYAYTPTAGTILPAGNGQTLSLIFTPTDSSDYNIATRTAPINVAPAPLLVAATNASRTFGTVNPALSYTLTGLVGGDTPSSSTAGAPVLGTTGALFSLPGAYPITIAQGTLAAPNYLLTFVGGTLTVLPTAPAPQSGGACDGAYTATFKGNLKVAGGQHCVFISGGVTGNIQVDGGTLILNGVQVGGNVQVSGGGSLSMGPATTVDGDVQVDSGAAVSIGPSTIITGALSIKGLTAGVASNNVCGTTVNKNLDIQGNDAPIQIGSSPSSACAGNTVGGNLTVQNNTAPTVLAGNFVTGNLQDQNNTAPTQVLNNMIGKNLICQSNTSIAGSGNTADSKQGQCAAF